MDIEEWEFLPDDGFFDFHEDGEKKIPVGKRNSTSKGVFNMNYFVCPSPNSRKIIEPSPQGNSRVVPVPIHLDSTIGKATEGEGKVKEITKIPGEIKILAPTSITGKKIKAPNIESTTTETEADQDSVSQVFFKIKTKETEFVDMKMDSPKSSTARGIIPQIDAGGSTFNFEEKSSDHQAMESKLNSPRKMTEKEMEFDSKKEITWEENGGGLNLWKWSLSGIGAICSFGVAAATICIIILGNHQRNKQQQQSQNQKIRIQIYTDHHDKRIKQVVHHATKLNEAISAVRGVPITRAHITCGGFYDGL